MSTPTTVEPVAWVDVADAYEGPYDFHGAAYLPAGKTNLYSQATVYALQARVDELETQLFIKQAPVDLCEAMGLEPMPPFPTIQSKGTMK